MKNMSAPGLQTLHQYDVNRVGAAEGVWQPVFDFTTYAAAGQAQLSFFQTPLGQGTKTVEDTNMQGPGQFPAPIQFLMCGLEVVFFSGVNAYTLSAAAEFASGVDALDDAIAVMKTGALILSIGQKIYLQDGPLGAFPPHFWMSPGPAAITSTNANAVRAALVAYGNVRGEAYDITPLRLPSNQNFTCTLNWKNSTNGALPSSTAGRVGVRLNGWQYRLSQ